MKRIIIEKLNWGRLQQNQCPKCGRDLMYEDHQRSFTCQCSFRISMTRFKEIIESRVEQNNEDRIKSWKRNNNNY